MGQKKSEFQIVKLAEPILRPGYETHILWWCFDCRRAFRLSGICLFTVCLLVYFQDLKSYVLFSPPPPTRPERERVSLQGRVSSQSRALRVRRLSPDWLTWSVLRAYFLPHDSFCFILISAAPV